MPIEPRSWTANSSMRLEHRRRSPWAEHAVTASIQLLTGGSWCQLKPSQRSTPNAADHPDRPGGMPLHDRGVEHAGQHDEVPLGARRAVEHHPLVRCRRCGAAASSTARRRTGGRPSSGCSTERPAGDVELRPGRPRRGIRPGLEDRAAARDPPLVDGRAQRMIDLLHQHRAEGVGPLRRQPALLEVLGESPQSPGRRFRHLLDATASTDEVGRSRPTPGRESGSSTTQLWATGSRRFT